MARLIGTWYRTSITVAAVGLIFLLGAPTSAGENRLRFQSNDLSDDEWAYVRRNYLTDEDIEIMADVRGMSREDLLAEARKFTVKSVRFDIDEDGRDELIVVLGLGLYCGSAGCITLVLERADGKLRLLTEDQRYGGSHEFLRDDERADYYPYADPRFAQLVSKYGLPHRTLTSWMMYYEDGVPCMNIPVRARIADVLPAETVRALDAEMRRRVGPDWDDIVRAAEEVRRK